MCARIRIMALLLCAISCGLQPPTKASASSLSNMVLLECLFKVKPLPIRLDDLEVRWERDGRRLVEYSRGTETVEDSRAILSVEELKKGNASLTLTNLTLMDSGNYTCVVQYGKTTDRVNRVLNVEAEMMKNWIYNAPSRALEHADNTLDSYPVKIGMVMGTVSIVFAVALILFFCYAG
ncbi:programmed cell death 1 ligand 1-like [Ascaphus truei]|uniref:programmed cell death 1 ligand 1-like n=1 Tax=Ascaphus truei TaxID=8439 RepID=UPI003F5983D4